MQIMPGPDFPTGGIVVNKDELTEIYRTGAGKIKIRGRVEVEKLKGGKGAAGHYGDTIYHDRVLILENSSMISVGWWNLRQLQTLWILPTSRPRKASVLCWN